MEVLPLRPLRISAFSALTSLSTQRYAEAAEKTNQIATFGKAASITLETTLDREDDRLRARPDAEFVEHIRDVITNGLFADR